MIEEQLSGYARFHAQKARTPFAPGITFFTIPGNWSRVPPGALPAAVPM